MVHTVHFRENNDVKKIYRIRILNDNSKKNLKIVREKEIIDLMSVCFSIENSIKTKKWEIVKYIK